MRITTILTALMCLTVFYLAGCSEYTDVQMTEPHIITDSYVTTGPGVTIADPELLYETLWTEYGGHFNTQSDLEALRSVTASQTYFNYLGATHPTEVPYRTFAEYHQVAPPDPERYLMFLQQWVEAPSVEDIALVHEETLHFRVSTFKDFAYEDSFVDSIVSLTHMILHAISFSGNTAIYDLIQNDDALMPAFMDSFSILAYETLKADAIWLGEQMETYGTEQGLVRSAIYNPALMSEMLDHFSSIEALLRWVEETPDLADSLIASIQEEDDDDIIVTKEGNTITVTIEDPDFADRVIASVDNDTVTVSREGDITIITIEEADTAPAADAE